MVLLISIALLQADRGTHGLFGRIVRDNPRTFLDQSSKQYLTKSTVAAEQEPNDDSRKGEGGFDFGRDLGFGLLDDRFGQVGEEIRIRPRGVFVQYSRGGGRRRVLELFNEHLVDVVGL